MKDAGINYRRSVHLMGHAIGFYKKDGHFKYVNGKMRYTAWRNYFAAARGSKDQVTLSLLAKKGLVTQRRINKSDGSRLYYYSVTPAGFAWLSDKLVPGDVVLIRERD